MPTPPYLDLSLPIADRVADLLSHLTLDEKVSQMGNAAAAVPRLGMPAYDFWSEGLHGVARNGRATVFPQAIGLAATWDADLIRQVASAIGDEARAKYHATLRRNGATGRYEGITLWSPNVNLFRDPRWGRGQETWGEDPFLTGELASAFVRGLQGDDPHYLKTAACAKHYAVHSGPEAQRHAFNAVVSQRDLHASYLSAFKKLVVDGQVEAVMGAYNRTNAEACCASPTLLDEILRRDWGFEGHVVSDCGALTDMHRGHRITVDAAESAALALKAGCDMACDTVYRAIPEAIARGLISEADVDRALVRTLTARFKLGMFDPPERVPYAQIGLDIVGSDVHRELAYQAAVRSVVLLENAGGFLPLGADVRTILVVGPAAGSIDVLLGNYHGLSDRLVTFVEGLVGAVPDGVRVKYRPGSPFVGARQNPLDWSLHVAAESDVTVACMGLSPLMEGEEGDAILSPASGDRVDLGLPAVQVEYLKELTARGARVVLVLTGGGPITLGGLEELVEAVLFAWYPGQEGGRAVADILLGRAVPSGKLPITFPQSVDQLPPFEEYTMRGRTYRYAAWQPLYPFGYGLSYTEFEYSGLWLESERLAAGDPLYGGFALSNTGPVAADEVVQIYLTDLEASVKVPRHSLVAFQRVHLAPGERREMSFTIGAGKMMLVDDEGRLRLEPGTFRLAVGGCSPGERSIELGVPRPLIALFGVD